MGLPPITISVNVSARQFRESDGVTHVAAALKSTGLVANCLELELTECLIMQNPQRAILAMHELRALGAQIAIDDFGTGYSSLSSLKNFPITRLKIDKSFTEGLPDTGGDNAITSAIITLGHALNLKGIAEGV
jgi:EAL domain-containing protein (putative c-di-GMP-specific phosphodiesterase class I)